jgi:DNA cross-link repair 1A protein
MFRQPRERASRTPSESVLPSVGRPPTPPQTPSMIRNSSPYFGPTATPTPNLAGMKAHLVQGNPSSKTPSGARKATVATSNGRIRSQPNQSILNFFAKSDRSRSATKSSTDDQELFFQDGSSSFSPTSKSGHSVLPASLQEPDDDMFDADLSETRYNESSSPVKRRRIDSRETSNVGEEDTCVLPDFEQLGNQSPDMQAMETQPKERKNSRKQRGPFIEDSDSEEEGNEPTGVNGFEIVNDGQHHRSTEQKTASHEAEPWGGNSAPMERNMDTRSGGDNSAPQDVHEDTTDQLDGPAEPVPDRPSLNRESTSVMQMDDFEGMEDFDDEFYEEGEEYAERRWLEEQRMIEEGLDEDSKSESAGDSPTTPIHTAEQDTSPSEAARCPICNESMEGTTDAEASAHVNGCLDGKPTHLPAIIKKTEKPVSNDAPPHTAGAKRFQRAAIAKPAQENPYSLSKGGLSGSAFSKLMSGHAEDAAWAAAAANEASSRGKPAYQRTCPFYKIMPGLYICVDAFRYGKVEGQNAYFLSHFHSDHYIGLTSSWCHGPIYCSKVTANLVRQQLKVDPQWVVDLEFEKKVEIPNTQGVYITMIPANHCPGSSLFLFEKTVGRGANPKVIRILHCGDFRACPAHVNHPLLRPDIVDAISGKTRQQIIDTCYLDTTYLTPKYAFPSQDDVISSCADMCVSLSKEIPDSNDNWERAKLERAGSGMAKFLEKGSTYNEIVLKKEEDTEDVKPTKRGRLLVIIGTYSIGKERICLGIARALNSKIYAPPAKQRICLALEDPELTSRLTSNPLEAQVHMQMLMEIRAETLHDYLQGFKPHFSRIVGFRPTGWNYRPPTSRFTENPAVSTVLNSEGWKSRFSMKDLVPQRGSTRESSCFGVPYSEHSSFRELSMFCCALRIGRVVPTVNVGSARSREKMKLWVEKWEVEKKKSGLFRVEEGATSW